MATTSVPYPATNISSAKMERKANQVRMMNRIGYIIPDSEKMLMEKVEQGHPHDDILQMIDDHYNECRKSLISGWQEENETNRMPSTHEVFNRIYSKPSGEQCYVYYTKEEKDSKEGKTKGPKAVSKAQVTNFISEVTDKNIINGILIVTSSIKADPLRLIATKNTEKNNDYKNYNLIVLHINHFIYDLPEHLMVPKFIKLSKSEAKAKVKEMLPKELGIKGFQQMSVFDPMAKSLGLKAGDVVKIERDNGTLNYRLVVNKVIPVKKKTKKE